MKNNCKQQKLWNSLLFWYFFFDFAYEKKQLEIKWTSKTTREKIWKQKPRTKQINIMCMHFSCFLLFFSCTLNREIKCLKPRISLAQATTYKMKHFLATVCCMYCVMSSYLNDSYWNFYSICCCILIKCSTLRNFLQNHINTTFAHAMNTLWLSQVFASVCVDTQFVF